MDLASTAERARGAVRESGPWLHVSRGGPRPRRDAFPGPEPPAPRVAAPWLTRWAAPMPACFTLVIAGPSHVSHLSASSSGEVIPNTSLFGGHVFKRYFPSLDPGTVGILDQVIP